VSQRSTGCSRAAAFGAWDADSCGNGVWNCRPGVEMTSWAPPHPRWPPALAAGRHEAWQSGEAAGRDVVPRAKAAGWRKGTAVGARARACGVYGMWRLEFPRHVASRVSSACGDLDAQVQVTLDPVLRWSMGDRSSALVDGWEVHDRSMQARAVALSLHARVLYTGWALVAPCHPLGGGSGRGSPWALCGIAG